MSRVSAEYFVRFKRLGYCWEDLMQTSRLILYKASQRYDANDPDFSKLVKTALRRTLYLIITRCRDAMVISNQFPEYENDAESWVLGSEEFDASVFHVKDFLNSIPSDLKDLSCALMSGMSALEISQDNDYGQWIVYDDIERLQSLYTRYAGGEVA